MPGGIGIVSEGLPFGSGNSVRDARITSNRIVTSAGYDAAVVLFPQPGAGNTIHCVRIAGNRYTGPRRLVAGAALGC